MSEPEVVKLQAQLHKLQGQLNDVQKDRENLNKELGKLKEMNKRGDMELRRASDVIAKSKDMRALQGLQEEKEMYEMQLKQLQTILRTQMEDLEKYKRIAAEATSNSASTGTTVDNGQAKQKELQERIIKLRNDIKEAEAAQNEINSQVETLQTTMGNTTDTDEDTKTKLQEAEQNMIIAQGKVTELKIALQTAEEEAEDSASAAIKATRARERAEREHKEKLNALEQALATSAKEVERLSEEKTAAETAHARDLENLLGKLQEKDIELATFRAERKQAADNASDATAQIEEMRKSRDEAIRLRETETKSKEDEIKRLTKDKEKEFEKTIKDKEKEYEKTLKDKEKEYEKTLKDKEKEHEKVSKEKEKEYEKTIKEKDDELKKAVAAAKKAAAAEEFQSEKADMMKKIEAANLMVAQLTESAAAADAAKSDAIEEAKLSREKLIKREQKLTAVTQEKAEAQAQVQELSADVKSLSKKLEKSKIAVRSGEETLRQTKQELDKTQNELRKVTDARDKLIQELNRTKDDLAQVKGDYDRTLASWEAVSAESTQRADAIEQLEIAVNRAQTQIEEQRNEYLIATKLTKQSNKELKTALAAETRKVAKLERDLLTARKTIPGTPGFGGVANSGNRGVPSSPALTSGNSNSNVTGNTGSPMRNPSSAVGNTPRTDSNNFLGVPAVTPNAANAGAVNSVRRMNPGNNLGPSNGLATPPGVPRTQSNQIRQPVSNARVMGSGTPGSGGKNLAPMGGGNMEETVKLLGTRLKDVLAEAEVAREKVKMLEGIVQSVSDELADKKRLLKELTSTSGGAVDDSGAMETVRSAGTDPSLLQNLLQKSMSENARLKRDMKVLGKEIMEAQDKARKADEMARKAMQEKQQAIEAQIALQSQYNNENYSIGGDINDNGSVTISERGDGGNLYAESPSLMTPNLNEENEYTNNIMEDGGSYTDNNSVDGNNTTNSGNKRSTTSSRPVVFSNGSTGGNPFGNAAESGNPFGAPSSSGPKTDANKSANPFG